MSQFQLNDNTETGPEQSPHGIDSFTEGYVEAFMFTNADSGDDREHRANDLGTRRITKKSWQSIIADCAAFQAHAKPLLDLAYQRSYDEEQAGRDFWFTRQGHGVGYWDRDELKEGELGKLLTKLAKTHGEMHMCQIYRGWIYHD